ncbi:hypothetical protein cypCar_00038787 [Cyprinus carpio]|nr:hypothetical protein cypCar_00038787 [Cyprinus carpio]
MSTAKVAVLKTCLHMSLEKAGDVKFASCEAAVRTQMLLNLSLTSDLVPDQDVIDVIIHVGRNPLGRHLAWRYFREKWDILNSRYGEALFMNSKLISGVTEFLNTEAELNEVRLNFNIILRLELKEFILTSGGESAPAFARAVEIVQANVKWHILFQQQFYRWLRKAPDG